MKIVPIVTAVVFMLSSALFAQDTPAVSSKSAVSTTSPVKQTLKTRADSISYLLGCQYGQALSFVKDSINLNLVTRGLKDQIAGRQMLVDPDNSMQLLKDFKQNLLAIQQRKLQEESEKNTAAGKAFLQTNKMKKGVECTPSGLQIMTIKEGTGPRPSPTDKVVVNYRGLTIDGKEFTSTFKPAKPKTISLDNVIKGWQEGIRMMRVGGTYRLFLPPELGYGSMPVGTKIGPAATLIFDIELLEITH